MKRYYLFAITAWLLTGQSVYAVDLVIDGGLHFGGDRLATVYSEQGYNQDIRAGELFSVAIGLRFDISESWEIPITLGMKTAKANLKRHDTGERGEVRFIRFPLNTALLYKMANWRFGAGLTYHINPELKEDGGGFGYAREFENALGTLVGLRYYFSDNAYVGARYTRIEYEVKNTGTKFDGSSIGVVLGANL